MNRHHRHSVRLQGYDYSQSGAYFVTICAYNRECLFGEIVGNDIRLNDYGVIAKDEWIKSSEIRKEIKLDEFVVMSNHIHGIVWINNPVGANGVRPYIGQIWVQKHYRHLWQDINQPLQNKSMDYADFRAFRFGNAIITNM